MWYADARNSFCEVCDENTVKYGPNVSLQEANASVRYLSDKVTQIVTHYCDNGAPKQEALDLMASSADLPNSISVENIKEICAGNFNSLNLEGISLVS
jgi:hypothetical protein